MHGGVGKRVDLIVLFMRVARPGKNLGLEVLLAHAGVRDLAPDALGELASRDPQLVPVLLLAVEVSARSASTLGTNWHTQLYTTNGDFVCNLIFNKVASFAGNFHTARVINNTNDPQQVVLAPNAFGGGGLHFNIAAAIEQ